MTTERSKLQLLVDFFNQHKNIHPELILDSLKILNLKAHDLIILAGEKNILKAYFAMFKSSHCQMENYLYTASSQLKEEKYFKHLSI